MTIETAKLQGFDPAQMYRAEQFTDMQHGDIHRMTPVDKYGAIASDSRTPRYFSSVALDWRGQRFQVSFEIEGAGSLADAIEKFPAQADAAARKQLELMEAAAMKQALGGGLLNAAGAPLKIATDRTH